MKHFSLMTVVSSITFLLNIVILTASADETEVKPMSTLDVEAIFPDYNVKLLGMDSQSNSFLTLQGINNRRTEFLASWNVRRSKTIKKTLLSKWLSAHQMLLSNDGNEIVTDNRHSILFFPNAKGYRITSVQALNLKTHWTRNVRSNENSGIFTPLVGEDQWIAIGIQNMIPFRGKSYFGRIHFEFASLTTGETKKTLHYGHVGGCNSLVLSSKRKYLLTSFTSKEDDTMDEQPDRQGIVEVLDFRTGKILWHLVGTDKQPVGDPLFFISPTRFVSSDTLFDIATHKAQRWSAITPTRKCLAAVPNHSSDALFLTPQGLELRNWQKNKTLVLWPNIKKPGRIMFSPDLKMFSFKRGSLIQFWKFDPKWIR